MENKLVNLDNWKVTIQKAPDGVYMLDATHISGETYSLKGADIDSMILSLRAYARAVETDMRRDSLNYLVSNWKARIREVSTGVYALEGTNPSGAEFFFRGTANDGGELVLRTYAAAVEDSTNLGALRNLNNWRVEVNEVSPDEYNFQATHSLVGLKFSSRARDVRDMLLQLRAYVSEVEKAIEVRQSMKREG